MCAMRETPTTSPASPTRCARSTRNCAAPTPSLPFRLDARTLAKGDAFTFTTDLGAIDLLATPAGTEGFDELARTADAFELFGQRVLVASLDDLIRMKRAAGRTKDLLAVEELGALRDELDQRS